MARYIFFGLLAALALVFGILHYDEIKTNLFHWTTLVAVVALLVLVTLHEVAPVWWAELVSRTGQFREAYAQALARMDPDEEPVASVWASKVWIEDQGPERKGALVATTRRVMFASGQGAEGLIFSFPYEDISDFYYEDHFLYLEIHFQVSGKPVEFRRVYNNYSDIVEVVYEKVSGGSPEISG